MSLRRSWTALAAVAVASAALTVGAAPASAALAAPTELAPANTTIDSNPTLSWASVAGAARYDVQVSMDSSFATTVYAVTTSLTAATPATTIGTASGGTVFWRVRAVDGAGGSGSYATAQFARTGFPAPVLLSPADAAVLPFPGSPPEFSWTPLPAIASYVLQIDDASDFVSATSYTTANPSYVLSAPQPADQEYFWRVQGVTKDGVATPFSDVRTYTIGPIGKPAATYPPDTTDPSVDDVVLAWSSVPGAATYDLQVSPNIDFTNNSVDIQGVKATRWSPTQTLLNGSYFWRVRARDTQGAFGGWSGVSTFRRAWPAVPTLLQPANGGRPTDQGPTFHWTPVALASRYELDLGSDQNFSPGTYLTCHTNHTTFTPQLQPSAAASDPDCSSASEPTPGLTYYWRVRGLDDPAGVLGVFSAVSSFIYDPDAAGVTQLSPADGATVQVPTLSWSALPNVSSYEVQLFGPSGAKLADVTTAALSWTSPTQLPGSGPYSWRVFPITQSHVAYAAVERSFSLTASSTTGATPDPLMATTDNGSRMPAMSWQPVTGATSYQVWIATPGSGTFFQLGSTYYYPATTYPAATDGGFSVLAPGTYSWYVVANTSAGAVQSSPSTYTVQPLAQVGGYDVDSGWNGTSGIPVTSCLNGTSADSACAEWDTPTLRWQAVPGAGFYLVYISTDAAHTNIVATYASVATQLTPRASLKDSQAGQTYYWFARPCVAVTACGPLGDVGTLNFSETFLKRSAAESGVSTTVGTPPSTWPSADCVTPVPAPATSPPIVSDQVTFCWDDYLALTQRAGVLSDQEARSYRLQVSTASDFSTLLDAPEVDQTTYTATTKTYPEGPLYWRVQAVDGSGNPLTYSPTYQLLKSSSAPVAIGPASQARVDQAPVLTWAPQPFAASYEAEIYKNANPALSPDTNYSSVNRLVDASTKEAAYSDTASLPSGTYAWRVRRLDADGRAGSWQQSVGGQPLLFSVSPAPPTLLSPSSGSTPRPGSLVFSWTAAPGAAGYRLESSGSPSFSLIRERQDTVSLAWAPTARYPTGTYYWRVSALDGGGHVLATSSVWSFSVDATPPTVLSRSPATTAGLTTSYAVTFSEPVQGADSTRFVLWSGSHPVAATVTASSDRRSAWLRPSQPLEPGARYTVRLSSGISDLAGNPLAPVSWSVRAATIVDSTSVAVHEMWARQALRGTIGGHYVQTATAGASASIAFTGTSVALLGRTLPAGGYASVRLDGGPAVRVGFYSSTSRLQRVVYKRTALRAGPHRLLVIASGTHPAASKGAWVALDAVRAGSTVLDDAGPGWSVALRRAHTRLAFGGSYDVERAVHSRGEVMPSYTVSFTGAGLTLYAIKCPTGGKATVSIDGRVLATVDLYAARASRAAVFTRTVSAAHHVLRLTVAGSRDTQSKGTDVAFDYLLVR